MDTTIPSNLSLPSDVLVPSRPAPAAARSPFTVRGRVATLGLFTALSLTCYVDRFIMGALVTPVKLEFGLTDEQVGRIEAVFNLAYVVAVPVFGFLGDRIRRKGLLLAGLLVWSVASIGSGFAYGLSALLFWRVLVGLGEGGFSSVSPTWLADVFPARSRSMVFSVFNSVSKVGATIGVALGGYVASRYSWHAAFWVAGVPGILLAIGLLRAREPVRGAADVQVAQVEKPTFRESLRVFALPNYVLHVVGYLFYMVALSSLFYWGPAYLHRVFDVPNITATGFFGVGYTVSGLPGVYAGGLVGALLVRRLRAGYALCLSLAMILVTPVLAAAFLVQDVAVFKLLIWAEMFLLGACSAVITALLIETVSVTQRGVALGFALVISTGAGGLIATEILGILSDRYGLARAMFVVPAAAALAAIAWSALAIRQSRSIPAQSALAPV